MWYNTGMKTNNKPTPAMIQAARVARQALLNLQAAMEADEATMAQVELDENTTECDLYDAVDMALEAVRAMLGRY